MGLLESILWLTLNVYHEAGGEIERNRVAVANVTINRAREKGISIKEVVLQPKQFSWVEEGKFWPNDVDNFVVCLGSVTLAAMLPDITDGATYFHDTRVEPYWATEYVMVASWGKMKFYKE